MLGAGLLAQKAVALGMRVQPYIKTSLSPGSGVVTYYLRESGVIPCLEALGFGIVGYGCMTCIGNSGQRTVCAFAVSFRLESFFSYGARGRIRLADQDFFYIVRLKVKKKNTILLTCVFLS